jgi:uncharacterized membrane protein YbhN (UPF0104 family)
MLSERTLFRLKLVLLPAGIGTLIYWASQEDSLRRGDVLGWPLIAGALLSLVAMLPLALRFRLAMRIAGFHIDVPRALLINALSAFYHFFVPLSIGSELTKFVHLRAVAPEHGSMRAAGAILLEHALGFTAILLLLGLLLAGGQKLPVAVDPVWAWTAVGVANAIGLVLAWRIRARIRREGGELLARIATHRADAAAALAWSILMQVLLAAAVALGSSAWGFGVSFGDMLFVLAASNLLAAVPLNVAGIGAAELAGTGLFIALGLTSREAVLLVSLLFCYKLLFALAGGTWDFIATHRRPRGRADAPGV